MVDTLASLVLKSNTLIIARSGKERVVVMVCLNRKLAFAALTVVLNLVKPTRLHKFLASRDIDDVYELGGVLGKGAYSVVKEGRAKKSNEQVCRRTSSVYMCRAVEKCVRKFHVIVANHPVGDTGFCVSRPTKNATVG